MHYTATIPYFLKHKTLDFPQKKRENEKGHGDAKRRERRKCKVFIALFRFFAF